MANVNYITIIFLSLCLNIRASVRDFGTYYISMCSFVVVVFDGFAVAFLLLLFFCCRFFCLFVCLFGWGFFDYKTK